ncbi:MAG: hypothetical protein JST82_00685 [Bacteroidetes bacterium]|nr:hypothetical protein [Bacteroidota bacterium]
MKQSALFMILTCILMVSCQKKDDTPAQPSSIVINLSAPSDGHIFRKGDTVFMKASVSYISQLHGYELSIKNKATGESLFYDYQHTYTDKFDINKYWVDTVNSNIDMKLELTVQIDHDGNQSTKELSLKSQP